MDSTQLGDPPHAGSLSARGTFSSHRSNRWLCRNSMGDWRCENAAAPTACGGSEPTGACTKLNSADMEAFFAGNSTVCRERAVQNAR